MLIFRGVRFQSFQSVETVQARIDAVVQVLSTLAGGNGNLTTKVEESARQMAKQGTLTALKLAKISAGEFVDAMGTMPEQDSMICLTDILGRWC